MKIDPFADPEDEKKLRPAIHKNMVNFFFELGMLKKTPRSGFQFLGSGKESVADHSFRMALIGYSLARMTPDVDTYKVLCLCLFHDVPETRIGDMNYVNKQYVTVNEKKAINDLAETLPFGDDLLALYDEYKAVDTVEAKLAHDADQLDLILELKGQSDLGNTYAPQWINFALKRLVTGIGREVADEILRTDSASWWFADHDHWWHKVQEG